MNEQHLTRRQALLRGGLLAGAAMAATPASLLRGASAPTASAVDSAVVYCLNTGTIRGQKLGLVKEIEIAAQAGYQAIEPWIEAIDQYAKGGGNLKELKTRLGDLGLTMESAIGFPEWIVDDDTRRAAGLERARREMDMVAQLGGKRIAAPPAGANNAAALDLTKAADRYRALLEVGDSLGVVPQMEMWGPSKNVHLLSEAAFIVLQSGHPKACVLADVFHLYKGGSDFSGLRLLSRRMLQVFHMNDYPADPPRDKTNDSFRVFPGDGVAPMAQILKDLLAGGPRVVLSLELFSRKYWEQDALEVAKAGLEKMKSAVAKAAA
jgi:2-keto-myo-inositol isomerase